MVSGTFSVWGAGLLNNTPPSPRIEGEASGNLQIKYKTKTKNILGKPQPVWLGWLGLSL